MARTDFDAVCNGKQPHPDKVAARTAANRTRATTPGFRGRLNTYSCPFAPAGDPHWHVGHIAASQLRRRRRHELAA